MAIGVMMDFKGGTLDHYDQVIGKMGLVRGGQMPQGGLSHWVCATGDGIRVTDVWETREQFEKWETREQFEKFAQEQIGPITQEVGMPGPPEITYHDAHNYLLRTEAAVPA